MRIGPRLRLLRQGKGLSLRELAEQTDFSASFLSLVENDKASPSVSSLERIARVFGLSLAEFFQVAEEPPCQIVRTVERQAYISEWSHTVVEMLAQRAEGGALYPLILRLAPGARSGKRPRASLTEEFAMVLEGQVVAVLEEEEAKEEELGPGDSLSLAAGTPRAWQNRSDNPAVLLVVGHRARPVRSFEPSQTPEATEPEPAAEPERP